jgi:hypothetical protein
MGAQQGLVVALGVAARLDLFGLQHKVAALVAVDASVGLAAVTMGLFKRPLEHVVLRVGGVRPVHAEQVAQLRYKAL